jgi:predicted transcriptional regulator
LRACLRLASSRLPAAPALCFRFDRGKVTPYAEAMEVHLSQNQEVQLNELATKTGRGTDELVQEAVAQMLAHAERFKQQVQVGIDQIARGEFIEEDEMDARVERMLQS